MPAGFNGQQQKSIELCGKEQCLHLAFNYLNQPPDLVVAFGTAAYLMPKGTSGNQSYNGCVVLGSHAFLHNANPNGQNPDSVWDDPADFEKLQNSALSPDFWKLLDATFVTNVSSLLLTPPLNPAPQIRPISSPDFIALNTINVTNSAQYATKDQESVDALAKTGNTLPIGSIETTHGIIRIQSQAPFLFVSGIVNREGYFGTEVVPHLAAQNFTGAFNAGIVVAWLLPLFVNFLSLR